ARPARSGQPVRPAPGRRRARARTPATATPPAARRGGGGAGPGARALAGGGEGGRGPGGELRALAAERSPLYVYDAGTLGRAARRLLSLGAADRVLYSIKANNPPGVLRLFHSLGLGFECVSAAELEHVLRLFPDVDRELLLF